MQPVTANLLKLLQHMNANVICDRKLTCSDDHLTVSTCKIQANGSFIPQNDQTIHIWANWWDEKMHWTLFWYQKLQDIRLCHFNCYQTFRFIYLFRNKLRLWSLFRNIKDSTINSPRFYWFQGRRVTVKVTYAAVLLQTLTSYLWNWFWSLE